VTARVIPEDLNCTTSKASKFKFNSMRPSTASPQQQMPQQYKLRTIAEAVGATDMLSSTKTTRVKRSTAAASGSRRGGHEGCRRQGGRGGRGGGRDGSNTLKATMTPTRNVATLPREAQYRHWGNIGYHDHGVSNHSIHSTTHHRSHSWNQLKSPYTDYDSTAFDSHCQPTPSNNNMITNTNSKSPSNTNSNSSLQKEQTEPFATTMTPKSNVATLPREAQYRHWGNIGYHDHGVHTTHTLWTSFDQSRQYPDRSHINVPTITVSIHQ